MAKASPRGPEAAVDLDPTVHAPIRLAVLAYLAAVESADYVFLARLVDQPMGNLATHLRKLEGEGYVEVEKGFDGRRPRTTVAISAAGLAALLRYKREMLAILAALPA